MRTHHFSISYSGTKAEIEAFTGALEGALAHASDTLELLKYSAGAWHVMADKAYVDAHTGMVTNGDAHDHNGGDGGQIAHANLANAGTLSHAQIDSHIASTANPHSVTAAQVAAIPNNGWTATSAGTRVSDYVFSVADTTAYQKGTKVWWTSNNAPLSRYGVVYSKSTSSGAGNITLLTTTDFLLTSGDTISAFYYSYVENPIGWPELFTWAPTHSRVTTNYTNQPTVLSAKYKVLASNLIYVIERHQQHGTPGGTGRQQFTLPVACPSVVIINAYNESLASSFNGFISANNILILYKYDGAEEVTASQYYGVQGVYTF